jgi:Dockerin type I domain
MNGRDVSGRRDFAATEGAQDWVTVIVPRVALEAANWQVLRVASDAGDWNLNYIEITEARPTVPADFDGDGDVDLRDFNRFKSCYNGENRTPVAPNCEAADFDHDGDVDDADFAVFEKCFNGANRPPACQ